MPFKEQEAKSEYQVIDGKKVHVITPEVEITLTNTETGKEYTVILKKIIEQNSLTDFDDAKILPSSRRLKSII